MAELDPPSATRTLERLGPLLGSMATFEIESRADGLAQELAGREAWWLEAARDALHDPFERFDRHGARIAATIERDRTVALRDIAVARTRDGHPAQVAWQVGVDARRRLAAAAADERELRASGRHPDTWLAEHAERTARAMALEMALDVRRAQDELARHALPVPAMATIAEQRLHLLGGERVAALLEQAASIAQTERTFDDDELAGRRDALGDPLLRFDRDQIRLLRLERRREREEQAASAYLAQAQQLAGSGYRLEDVGRLHVAADNARERAACCRIRSARCTGAGSSSTRRSIATRPTSPPGWQSRASSPSASMS